MPIGCIISVVFCFVVSVPPLEMVSRSLVRFGLVGIELARISSDGLLLGVKVVKGVPLGSEVDLSSIACNFAAVSFRVLYLSPLDVCDGAGVSEVVGVDDNMPFLCRRERTWRIKAGTSEATAFLLSGPDSVSINSVNNRLVVVAVPGTNGNESSWGNHWSVSWVLVLLVAGL